MWIGSSFVNLHPSPSMMLHFEARFPRLKHLMTASLLTLSSSLQAQRTKNWATITSLLLSPCFQQKKFF
jgi:hypothetical protein